MAHLVNKLFTSELQNYILRHAILLRSALPNMFPKSEMYEIQYYRSWHWEAWICKGGHGILTSRQIICVTMSLL